VVCSLEREVLRPPSLRSIAGHSPGQGSNRRGTAYYSNLEEQLQRLLLRQLLVVEQHWPHSTGPGC